MFSLKSGTLMQGSRLPYRTWVCAIYIIVTSAKGVSSLKLHRDLGITQRTAWYLAHPIRKAFEINADRLRGPVEVDETYVGGKEKNKHAAQRRRQRGPSGKAIVAGMKDRSTSQVRARAIDAGDAARLRDRARRTRRPSLHGRVPRLQGHGIRARHRHAFSR